MSLTSELTKSDKGLFHVQICPPIGADKEMTQEDWLRAVEILEEETGFTNQKRALVMHEKNGRMHLHVVFERYDHDKGIMKSDSFSRLALDRSRQRMEIELEQERTPVRNKSQPEMKQYLTAVWQQTKDADAFIQAISKKGYIIATGTQRPYMVVDETGRSFDLTRQLKQVRTKEVRERFKTSKLPKEKEVILSIRKKVSLKKEKDKAIANDNVKQPEQKPLPKSLTMQASFSIEADADSKAKEQLAEVLKKQAEKEARKKEIKEKLRQASLQRAKEFRENEREM